MRLEQQSNGGGGITDLYAANQTSASRRPTPSNLAFVTAFIDLGPKHTEKTVQERLRHFHRLASSGITLWVYVSPVLLPLMHDARKAYPNIVAVKPVELASLPTVALIRSFPDLALPPTLTTNKDTREFLELMLAKIDFVHLAMASRPDASHLAWIDFNIAHVFDSSADALRALLRLQRRKLPQPLLVFPAIWDRGTSIDLSSLLRAVNWRFAGGFFIGDRTSLEQWYRLHLDALRLFLNQTQALTWEVNFWAWLEDVYPNVFHPTVYVADHDNSLVRVPDEVDK